MSKRVLMILSSGGMTGREMRALKLFRTMHSSGFAVRIVVPKKYRSRVQAVFPDLVDLISFVSSPSYLLRLLTSNKLLSTFKTLPWLEVFIRYLSWFEMRREILDFKPTVLHCFSTKSIPKFDGKIVYEVTSPDVVARLKKRSPRYLEEVDALLPVSPSVQQKLLETTGKNCTDAPSVPFFSRQDFNEFNGYDFKLKENVVLFAHRFIERKGALVFAKAACRFLSQNAHWRVEMCGFGHLEGHIREEIKKFNLTSRFSVSRVPSMKEKLKRSKIFVSLIDPDNYPSQSILEAMAAKNALLLSDTGDTRKFFFQDNGALISKSEDDVYNALIELSRSQEDLERMGKNSRDIASKKFDEHIYIQLMDSLYSS